MVQRMHQYAQLAAVVIVIVGCYLVLNPFIPAILFAAVVCSASWPLYARLRKLLWGNSTLAALVMSLILVVLVIGPSLLLAMSLSDNITALADTIKSTLEGGPVAPPDWLARIPLVGEFTAQYWRDLASSGDSLAAQSKGLIEPARNFLIATSKAVGQGLLQMVVATFIGFFFYRDGDLLMASIRKALDRLAGELATNLLFTIQHTVTGVVHGVFGTALAQALVAVAGFMIAGVPAALLLGVGTFFLSLVPVGPPLIWGGATIWLVFHGETGWAIFMFLWGLLFISTIDNVVKPYLISRSSNLPLLLIVLGVFGGVIAFGFIGVFIGPPVLAVGLTLVQLWIARPGLAKGQKEG
ncbi:MAG: AI-2E family transporter [Betaproteobacteria bacterium]|nr:AI-2E family transporter [Betaproteobacteria bacterium]